MNTEGPSFLYSMFRFIIAKRYWIVAIYAILLVPSAIYALRVESDNSLDRLIVQSDPDYLASRAFEKVFGTGEYVLLLAEAEDPFQPEVIQRLDQMERKLAVLPKVSANSVIQIYRRAKAGFSATPAETEALRRFATGSKLFRDQSLVGDHFIAIALVLDVHSPKERGELLAAIDGILGDIEKHPAPMTALRKVGQPYVNAYLDKDTRNQGKRYFPLFGLFVFVLNIALYRSFRTLLAFILALGMSAAMSMGYIGLVGGLFTMVSSLVPMTILITCTSTLVYLHSRFVERPADREVDDHQIFALCNKFLACTASIFATAVGFAALAVSKIQPIRQMGIWVAVGLCFTWVIVFTLFPALQKILRTPTEGERKTSGQWFERFVSFIPAFSYRFRYLLVVGSLVLCGVGAVTLFGIPGVIPRMELQTNAIEYINHNTALYKDTKRLEKYIAGLSMTEVWLQGPLGSLSKPEAVRALLHFEDALKADPHVGTALGLPSLLKTLRYSTGKGDALPEDDEALERITDTLESVLDSEPMLQHFLDKGNLSQTHLSVVTKTLDYEGFAELQKTIARLFAEAQARDPALKQFRLQIVGLAALQAKISFHLVPTLVESFILTVVIIYAAFMLVFRNWAARLMAMIPSLFAILVMFAFMRLFGMSLNVATILIASTVLGTSENDQIHFFYHFQEGRKDGSTEHAMRHTLLIAGRAIFFATLINAGGFLAFALADLPPVREFGLLSCIAFVLSMIADFTALPAALWMVFREKPDANTKPMPNTKPETKPDQLPAQ